MTEHPSTSSRLQILQKMVTDAVRLADELALNDVAVRLEQARILLTGRDSAAD